MNAVTEVKQAVTPAEMLTMAIDKGADIDQLSKLMDLQERWEARQAKKSYVEAMAAFKKNPPTITKDKNVHYSKSNGDIVDYNHATHNQVCNVIGTALSEHNLTHHWETEQLDGGIIKVTCIITHIDGYSETTSLQAAADTSGGKNTVQAVGSTVTYLQRYTLMSAAGVGAAENDNDGLVPFAKVSEKQARELNSRLDETKSDKKKFCEIFGIASIADLPASRFNEAVQAINVKAKK